MFGLTLAVTFFLKFRETLMTDFCDIFCAGFTQKDQTPNEYLDVYKISCKTSPKICLLFGLF